MTSRILPPEEYDRLIGTEAEEAIPLFTDAARVIVVEQDGEILGCQVLQPILHGEFLWVRPDHRKKSSVARRLWRQVQATTREHFGVRWFATAAVSDEVRGLLEHVQAVKLPDHYMVPVGAK